MRMVLLLLLLAPQRDSVVGAVIEEARTNSKVMEHLDHLTNRIGPRLTSSSNLERACEWTRDRFAEWGLDARLEEWGSFPVGFDRGPWSARMVEPEEMALTIGTNAWLPGTDGPVTGPAVLAPKDDEELKKLKPRLKGAWVISTRRGGAEKYRVAYEAAGVVGVIRSTFRDLLVTSGRSRISWDRLPHRVSVKMIASHHKKIVEHLKASRRVVLTIDIRNTFRRGPIPLFNVIADLKGTEKPDEFVIIGGHLDSWDGATGATDNGTGVSTTLEAARLLVKAGARPKRTIRFMLWTGEEQGLLGSRAYIRAHRDLLPKISAVIAHDGGTNYVSGIRATGPMMPLFEKVFRPVMDLDSRMKFRIRKVEGLPRFIGSDHDSFLAAGVPGFFWLQSRTAEEGQRYSHEHHTQHDVYSAAIPGFQTHSSIVIATAAWGIANLDTLLPRQGLVAQRAAKDQRRRLLGVQCEDDLTILEVVDGSSAQKAGLQPGDVILRLAGQKVGDRSALRERIQKAPLKTKIVVRRSGEEVELPVTFPK